MQVFLKMIIVHCIKALQVSFFFYLFSVFRCEGCNIQSFLKNNEIYIEYPECKKLLILTQVVQSILLNSMHWLILDLVSQGVQEKP